MAEHPENEQFAILLVRHPYRLLADPQEAFGAARIMDLLPEMIELQDGADIESVKCATVDSHDLVLRRVIRFAGDGHHAAGDRRDRRVRYIITHRHGRGRQQAVANAHFLHRAGHDEGMHIDARPGFLDQFGGADIGGLVSDHLAGVGIDQLLARPEDLETDGAMQGAAHVEAVPFGQVDLGFRRGGDARGSLQFARLDHQRLGQEGLDRAGRNRGDGLALQFFGTDLGRQLRHRRQAGIRVRAARPGKRQAAVRAVEIDDLARVDPVRIADLVAVHAPDIGPAPGMLEKLAGNIPQRIALDDDVLVRRIRAETAVGAGGSRCGLRRDGEDGSGQGQRASRDRERSGSACAKIFHQRVRKVRLRAYTANNP